CTNCSPCQSTSTRWFCRVPPGSRRKSEKESDCCLQQHGYDRSARRRAARNYRAVGKRSCGGWDSLCSDRGGRTTRVCKELGQRAISSEERLNLQTMSFAPRLRRRGRRPWSAPCRRGYLVRHVRNGSVEPLLSLRCNFDHKEGLRRW